MRTLTRLLLASALMAPGLRAQSTPDTALTLRLNIPAFRLEARRGTAVLRSMRVAVGQRRYRTPLGHFRVDLITWNPWWYPPPSPWAANDTVTPPCPSNPVGRVKLGFGNAYFIHGTPNPLSVGRAASHGCIRVAQNDALALAALVVEAVMPDSAEAAARYASGSATRSMRLSPPASLDIVYEIAEVRADTLWMYPDVYRRIPSVAARLVAARRAIGQSGRPPATVTDAELRALEGRSRRAAAYLPLTAVHETLTQRS